MEQFKKPCTRTRIRSVRASGSVSLPVRSHRALNPSMRRMAVQAEPSKVPRRDPNMHIEAKKVIVVGGSAGMGRQVALDVVDHGGSAEIVGRPKARVADPLAEQLGRGGP